MIYDVVSKNVSLEDALRGIESWGYVAEHNKPEIIYANIFNPNTGENSYCRFDYDTLKSSYVSNGTFEGLPAMKEFFLATYGKDAKFDVYCWLTDVVKEVASIPIKDLINRSKDVPLDELLINAKKKQKEAMDTTNTANNPSTVSAVNIKGDVDGDIITTNRNSVQDVSIISMDEAAELINEAIFNQEQDYKKIMNTIRAEYNRAVKDNLNNKRFTVLKDTGAYVTVQMNVGISITRNINMTIKHIEAFSAELTEHGIKNSFEKGLVETIYNFTIEYTVKKK